MRTRAFWMLGLAIIFAVAAVFLAQDWLNKRSAADARKILPTKMVVVAKTPLAFGAIIRKEHLRVIKWPAGGLPKGSFQKIDQLIKKGTNRVVLRRIEANEPILKTKVSGFGGRASLSTIISTDMRAATIRVNDVNGVAGFILPGDRVDVLLTRDGTSGNKRRGNNLITDVLLQNIKVLAIDQNSNNGKEKPSVAKAVTLEVTAHQTQKLILAQRVGSLALALRNVKNASAASVQTVRISDLRASEANDIVKKSVVKNSSSKKSSVKRVRATRRSSRSLSSVKIMRGLKSSDYKVPKENPRYGMPTVLAPRNAAPSRNLSRPILSPNNRHTDASPVVPNAKRVQPSAFDSSAPVSLYPRNIADGSRQNGEDQMNTEKMKATK